MKGFLDTLSLFFLSPAKKRLTVCIVIITGERIFSISILSADSMCEKIAPAHLHSFSRNSCTLFVSGYAAALIFSNFICCRSSNCNLCNECSPRYLGLFFSTILMTSLINTGSSSYNTLDILILFNCIFIKIRLQINLSLQL